MQNTVIENNQPIAVASKYTWVGQDLGRSGYQLGVLDLNQYGPGLQLELKVRRVDDRPAPAIPRPLKKVFFRWKPAPSCEVERHRLCPRAHDARVKTEGSTRARFKPAFVGRQAAGQPPAPNEPQAASEELVSIGGINGPVARMKRSSEGLEITLFDGSREGLVEWVEENRGAVIEQIIRMHEEKN